VVGELRELADLRVGLLHVHIAHTSASPTLNENASPDVRRDFETWFDAAVPESFGGGTHTLEGPDDMMSTLRRRCSVRRSPGRYATAASRCPPSSRLVSRYFAAADGHDVTTGIVVSPIRVRVSPLRKPRWHRSFFFLESGRRDGHWVLDRVLGIRRDSC
jgi:hypothetical protein